MVEFSRWEGDEDGCGDEEGNCGVVFEALEVGFAVWDGRLTRGLWLWWWLWGVGGHFGGFWPGDQLLAV